MWNNIFSMLASKLKQSVSSHCELDSADDEYTFISKNGSLVSVLELHGLSRLISWDEYLDLSERISDVFQPIFAGEGHLLQVHFTSDVNDLKSDLENATARMTASSKVLGLNLSDVLASRQEALLQHCHSERCYITIWTLPKTLPTIKQNIKSHAKKIQSINYPTHLGKQRILNVLAELRTIHQSLVRHVMDQLHSCGYYLDMLPIKLVSANLRYKLYPSLTSSEWRPSLPCDPITPKLDKLNEEGLSAWLWPSISEQIFPESAENLNLKHCQIDGNNYSSVILDLFPKDTQPFHNLMIKLRNAGIPWSFSAVLSGNGMSITKSKIAFAQLLAFSSFHNKLLVNSHNLLKYIEENSDNPIIKLSIVLTTWAPKSDNELLYRHETYLARALQSWGGGESSMLTGDPLAVVTGSMPAMSSQHYGTVCACPLNEAVKFMPFTSSASPWKTGTMLFRTIHGKLWPYQPGSNQQISWVDVIYARSGSGKSVLSNALNLAVCLSPGFDELPYIGIIDIGPSAKGLVSLLQNALPISQQSQIVYHKLQFSREHTCNPFDTMLGARLPTSTQSSFLVNFVSLLLLDPDEEKLPADMSSMVGMIVEKSYQQFKDECSPKEYIPGIMLELDEKLQQLQGGDGINTWWQVVDLLFEHQEYELARKAHIQAMPTLADTIGIVSDHTVRDLYGTVNAATGENYIQWYTRKVAGIIKTYPHLSNTTVLQISQAKIIVIDLDDVAKQGSKLANKQTSIAYMQARQLIAQNFFISADDLSLLPERYYEYHHAHIKNLMNQPKRLVYDEFHRTQGIVPVRDQILRDMREGRKWKVQISLASQSLHDFDSLMLEFATSIFILDAGTQEMLNKTASVFGLNDTQKKALQSATGPKKSGVNFLAQFVTKDGLNTQLLTATFGAVELWALTTTSEDAYIRDRLYQLMESPNQVRNMLAERFPDGTAKRYIETLSKKFTEKTTKHLCDDLINEMFEACVNYHQIVQKRRE